MNSVLKRLPIFEDIPRRTHFEYRFITLKEDVFLSKGLYMGEYGLPLFYSGYTVSIIRLIVSQVMIIL